jgi:hypothetical protein
MADSQEALLTGAFARNKKAKNQVLHEGARSAESAKAEIRDCSWFPPCCMP